MKRLLLGCSSLVLAALFGQACSEDAPRHEGAGKDAGAGGLDAAVDSGSNATDGGHEVMPDGGTPSGDGDTNESKDAGSDASVSTCTVEDSSGCLDQVAGS